MKIHNYFKNMVEKNITQEIRLKSLPKIDEQEAQKDLFNSKLY